MSKIDIHKLHTTEMGIVRIKRNLGLDTDDVVAWCKQAVDSAIPNLLSKRVKIGMSMAMAMC